ncbi:MAG: DUF4430 domain-containing protein [Oscillospiraceae bacterium]
MKTRRIMAAMLAAAASVSIAAAVSAEETPLGYVTFCADKAVLGQGLVTEPVNVPFYEGDNGIDIVQRAAEVVVVDGDWGSYIEGFADTDNGAELPAKIAEVCPDIGGRNTPGYLSSFDYTAESGWSWFLNDEYASVGIADYVPENGDVMQFRFTVYGYGCDLGVDNTSWGGSPALVDMVSTAELARLAAAADKSSAEYAQAVEVLGTFGITQAEIDEACAAFSAQSESEASVEEGGSPDTGVSGIAAAFGAALLACGVLAASKKR